MRSKGRRSTRLAFVRLVSLTLLIWAGGCGGREFQTSVVAAVETATQSIVAAIVTLYFDQYRPN